jgi:hypothetical protein
VAPAAKRRHRTRWTQELVVHSLWKSCWALRDTTSPDTAAAGIAMQTGRIYSLKDDAAMDVASSNHQKREKYVAEQDLKKSREFTEKQTPVYVQSEI